MPQTSIVKLEQQQEPEPILFETHVGTTVIAVLGFLLSALRPDELKQAFPFPCCWSPNPRDWAIAHTIVYVFWFFALVWVGLFTIQVINGKRTSDFRKARSKKTEQALSDAVQTIKDTNEAVQLLPSPEFRTGLARASQQAYQLLAKVAPRIPIAENEIPLAVRLLLNDLINLRSLYQQQVHDAPAACRYAANVMLYLNAPLPDAILADVRAFAMDEFLKGDQLAGALKLRRIFSTSSDDVPGREDPQIVEIALGIPLVAEATASPWILPGAAETFVRSLQYHSDSEAGPLISGHHNTLELTDIIERYKIPPLMAERLSAYFRKGPGVLVRSFLTLPLLRPEGLPFGVVSVHSDHAYLAQTAKQKERQLGFGLLAMPTVNSIAELLSSDDYS